MTFNKLYKLFLENSNDEVYLNLARNPEENKEILQRMVDEVAKAITAEEARRFLRPSEKEFGIDPRSGKMWVIDGKKYLLERMPMSSIEKNWRGDAYDTTVDVNRATEYSRRSGVFPPVILTNKPIDGKWAIKDGGHRISAARLRGDKYIDTLREFSRPDPVTYDENGNVIPLSSRFNSSKDDIRH